MKRIMAVCVLALCASACSQDKNKGGESAGGGAATSAPQTEDQKTLYALGMSIGRSVSVFDLSPEELGYVQAGLEAQVTGKPTAVKIEEYGPKIQELARKRQTAKAEKEKEKGKAALDAAAKQPGAQVTPSGLVYVSEKEGDGAQPGPTDIVKVHYRGTLTDGTEFDSSYKRNEPTTFPLNGVIPCWTEGLQKMKVGGKAKLTCPSAIAYGDRGAPPNIPGGAVLNFEVELLDVQKNTPPPSMQMQMPGMNLPPGHPQPGMTPPPAKTPPPQPKK